MDTKDNSVKNRLIFLKHAILMVLMVSHKHVVSHYYRSSNKKKL